MPIGHVPSRFNGRGGLGAVMGSKGIQAMCGMLKALPRPAYAEQAIFTAAMKQLASNNNTTPQTAETYRKYGTPPPWT
jgi:aldehyde:ferredoxin oxidoreductase